MGGGDRRLGAASAQLSDEIGEPGHDDARGFVAVGAAALDDLGALYTQVSHGRAVDLHRDLGATRARTRTRSS